MAMINADLNKPILGFRRKLLKTLVSFFCRIVLFFAGFYHIKTVEEKIINYVPNYQNRKTVKAPIIVSNHISWADTIFMISSPFCPSFLSKEEVSHFPLIGFVAKTLQALFVDRDSRTNKDLVIKRIAERSEEFHKLEGLPQLLIFPEGTNTNGKGILNFKRGAFHHHDNLQIICLEYSHHHFNLMMDDFGMGLNILLALCLFKHNLTVHVFDVFNPEYLNLKGEEDWEKYADVVKEIMTKCLKVKSCAMGYRDCLDYTEFLKVNDVIEDRKMNAHNVFSPERKSSEQNNKKNL